MRARAVTALALPALLTLAACGRPPVATPTGNVPVPVPETAPERLAPPERAVFILRRGADTLATERFARSRDLLAGDVAVQSRGSVEYQATLDPSGVVTRLVAGVVPPGAAPTAAATHRTTVDFLGDTLVIATQQGDSARSVRLATRPGVVPYINPSIALAEQIVRRARAIGGDSAAVPVFVASGSGQTLLATVAPIGADSTRLALAGTELRLATDGEGRVLGGAVPSQGVTIERATGAAEP